LGFKKLSQWVDEENREQKGRRVETPAMFLGHKRAVGAVTMCHDVSAPRLSQPKRGRGRVSSAASQEEAKAKGLIGNDGKYVGNPVTVMSLLKAPPTAAVAPVEGSPPALPSPTDHHSDPSPDIIEAMRRVFARTMIMDTFDDAARYNDSFDNVPRILSRDGKSLSPAAVTTIGARLPLPLDDQRHQNKATFGIAPPIAHVIERAQRQDQRARLANAYSSHRDLETKTNNLEIEQQTVEQELNEMDQQLRGAKGRLQAHDQEDQQQQQSMAPPATTSGTGGGRSSSSSSSQQSSQSSSSRPNTHAIPTARSTRSSAAAAVGDGSDSGDGLSQLSQPTPPGFISASRELRNLENGNKRRHDDQRSQRQQDQHHHDHDTRARSSTSSTSSNSSSSRDAHKRHRSDRN
jgi:hypothetical protein